MAPNTNEKAEVTQQAEAAPTYRGIFGRIGAAIAKRLEQRAERLKTAEQIKARAGYPATGTGKRQGERMQRNRLNYDFSATERCIAEIRARSGE